MLRRDRIDDIIELRKQGLTMDQIGHLVGCTKQRVSQVIKRHHAELGGRIKDTNKSLQEMEGIKKWFDTAMTERMIVKASGFSAKKVSYWSDRLNVPSVYDRIIKLHGDALRASFGVETSVRLFRKRLQELTGNRYTVPIVYRVMDKLGVYRMR